MMCKASTMWQGSSCRSDPGAMDGNKAFVELLVKQNHRQPRNSKLPITPMAQTEIPHTFLNYYTCSINTQNDTTQQEFSPNNFQPKWRRTFTNQVSPKRTFIVHLFACVFYLSQRIPNERLFRCPCLLL